MSPSLPKIVQDSLAPAKDPIVELGIADLEFSGSASSSATATLISPSHLLTAHHLIKEEVQKNENEVSMINNWKSECKKAHQNLQNEAASVKQEFDETRDNLRQLFGDRFVNVNNGNGNNKSSSTTAIVTPRQSCVESEVALGSYARLVSSNIQFRTFMQARRRQRTTVPGLNEVTQPTDEKFSVLEQTLGLPLGATSTLVLDLNRARAADAGARRDVVGAQAMRRDLKKHVVDNMIPLVKNQVENAKKELVKLSRD